MESPITLDALRVLDAIEKKKSFAAAADALFRVPSAISYTVNKLEDDLGVKLFDRTKRKAELTDVGKMVLEQGRLILIATEELTNRAKQSADGWELELSIAIDSVLRSEPIYRLISEFRAAYPWVDIKVLEESFGGTWDALASHRCDLVLGATGDTRDKNFESYKLGNVHFLFTVAKSHPLCLEQQPLSLQSIKQYPSIVVADSSRVLKLSSVGLLDGQPRITVPNIETKIALQAKGMGVGYLPMHRISDELVSGELVTLLVEKGEARESELYAIWNKKNKGKALAWFINKLKTANCQELLIQSVG
ncbi:LysR family transcriptional regulator [Vibrio sp. SS-MA-C1-2]|uniref:LysR family transcriptional regulator n=1 Tax=Vibrio sp. SS-MA-C1-2 TaxID=2908646 RepID=UPI001F3AC17D|nr:LysR family transcriptional regulator [Vibrio sp. SS-MA-C1-2]UJF20031.1 LysR family transcriptional regulator [Vibrio sp. SS-MA-C1-2]